MHRVAAVAAFLLCLLYTCSCDDKALEPQNIHLAALQSDIAGIEKAIECGEDINTKMTDGSCAINLAVWKNNQTVVKWLLDHGADVNCKTNAGQSVLHKALRNGDYRLFHLLVGKFRRAHM